MPMIPTQRHLFRIPREVCYLNCAYMSPLMNTVVDAGRAGLEAKQTPGLTLADFFVSTESGRRLPLLGGILDDGRSSRRELRDAVPRHSPGEPASVSCFWMRVSRSSTSQARSRGRRRGGAFSPTDDD
jgi:hypothetical protein